jgi:ribokinase
VLAADGVDTSAVQRVAGTPSGRALITVDDAGENSIVVVAGANRELRPAPLPAAAVVLAQLEIPLGVLVVALAQAAASGATTVLNPAPAQELPDELLRHCRIVIPNAHERQALGGASRLFDLGVEVVITTLGGEGVEVGTTAGNQHVPPFDVDPVDTTGAGDAFCGSLAAELARGAPLLAAVRFAAGAGALATTKAGAVPSLPDRDAIEALLVTRSSS